MKLFSKPQRPLGQAGIAHLFAIVALVLVVAIVAVYGRIAGKGPVSAATPNNGYMVIYSEKGGYSDVSVKSVNNDGKKCKGLNDTSKKLSAKKQVKLTCPATSQLGYYEVAYIGQSNAGVPAPLAVRNVDIDKGYCTLVFPGEAKTAKVKANGSKCPGVPDNITKSNVSVQIKPSAIANKKYATGYVDVSRLDAAGAVMPATRVQCTGAVDMKYSGGGNQTYSQPLKYVGTNGKSYCVAKYKHRVNLAAGQTYTVTADFKGNAHFNAAPTVSASFSVRANDW